MRSTPWLISIGTDSYKISGDLTREAAIVQAWRKHKGTIGIVIDTRREGEPDGDSVPWRTVDIAYRLLGNYPLAKCLDEKCVQLGFPSVLPPLV